MSLSIASSKYSLPTNFRGHFSLQVPVLPASCLFVSPTKERQSKKRPDKYLMSRLMQLDAGLRCCILAQGLPCCQRGWPPHWGTGTPLWRVARQRTPGSWCPTGPASAKRCWAWSLQNSLLIMACQPPAPPQISCNCVPPGAWLSDASLLLLLGGP